MENLPIIMLIEVASGLNKIIQHPNTPAYIQALIILIAALWGRDYLKKKATEHKFELIVKTYKCCLEASDVLIRLKQPHVLFKTLKDVEKYLQINETRFVDIVSKFAESYLDTLNKEDELFDKLYECYAEMRLFFNKDKKIIKPIADLLWSRNRIKVLFEFLILSKKQIEGLTAEGHESVLKTIRNGMVQIWENIELAEWQKEYEKKEEEIDGIKGVRKLYYLNDLINKARSDIDEILPELINSKVLSK